MPLVDTTPANSRQTSGQLLTVCLLGKRSKTVTRCVLYDLLSWLVHAEATSPRLSGQWLQVHLCILVAPHGYACIRVIHLSDMHLFSKQGQLGQQEFKPVCRLSI
jgi:hypothetical protein